MIRSRAATRVPDPNPHEMDSELETLAATLDKYLKKKPTWSLIDDIEANHEEGNVTALELQPVTLKLFHISRR